MTERIQFKSESSAPITLNVQRIREPKTFSKNNLYKKVDVGYREYIQELQLAIDTGDDMFAPAMKLLLREAVNLAHNCQNLSPSVYQGSLASVQDAYCDLLEWETEHPFARRLQQRYKANYHERFWDFLEEEKVLAQSQPLRHAVASEGNIGKNRYFVLKRVFDLVLASTLVFLLSPLMVLLYVLIKLDSPGPAIFVQKRVGARRTYRAGLTVWEVKPFDFYKFRSMHQNASEAIHRSYIQQWIQGDQSESEDKGAKFKLTNDPRITRVGHIIRRTSLDELPQLFNVLKGDMSLVGPRPVPTYEAENYRPEHWERLASVPGITGLWQVKGRGRVTFDEQIEMDIEYIYHQSIWLDSKILILTLPAVLSAAGAR